MPSQFTVCVQCGAPLDDPKHPNRKYCSQRCVGLSQRKREMRPCEVCGTEFYPAEGQRFCSMTCKGIAWSNSRPVPVFVCASCGQPFTPKTSHRNRGEGIYCSRQCSAYGRGKGKALKVIDRDQLRAMYEDDGLNIGTIAERVGVGRHTIIALMADFSIRRRTASEDKALAIAKMTPEERAHMMDGARRAVRGMKHTDEHRQKIARTRQDTVALSGDEAEIMAAFVTEGLRPIPLYAVHRYNIDFAFPDAMLAVEYNGGNWHNSEPKRAADEVKAQYLTDHGWRLLVFPRIKKRRTNNSGNRAIAIAEIVRQVREALDLA